MICDFCQYKHDNEGDRYGCPNCEGGEMTQNQKLAKYLKEHKTINKLWRNWPVHNLIAHPLSEVVYWLLGGHFWIGKDVCNYIHDSTLPDSYDVEGRG